MTDLETRIKQWADGVLPDRTLASRLRKLGEEVGELAEASVQLTDIPENSPLNIYHAARHAAAREAADCAIVLSDICSLLGYSLTGVMAEKVDQLQSVGSRSVPPPVCHSSAEAWYRRGCGCGNPSGERIEVDNWVCCADCRRPL